MQENERQEYAQNLCDRLKVKSYEMRLATLDMITNAKTGHLTSCFSCAETMTVLYHGSILEYDQKDPKWDGRDRFVLSKGQASPILYVTLADVGFFPKEWLDTFAKEAGKFGVHLQNTVPGVEVSTGSLGHGLGIGAGIAYAAKLDKKSYFTFVLLGDGECHEGSIWEQALFAGHHGLNNLIAIIDRNGQCTLNYTEDVLALNPLDKKWEAFGWDVRTINGHSIEEYLDALDDFRSRKRTRPYLIIADTIKGKGIRSIEGKPGWHARAPTSTEALMMRTELLDKINELKGKDHGKCY